MTNSQWLAWHVSRAQQWEAYAVQSYLAGDVWDAISSWTLARKSLERVLERQPEIRVRHEAMRHIDRMRRDSNTARRQCGSRGVAY